MSLEARQFMAAVQQRHGLAPVPSNIILSQGEYAFYSQQSILHETRAVRHYESSHAGFRVAKGLYLGKTAGRSVSTQEWSRIAAGQLNITNKRLIFQGGGADRIVPLSKIAALDAYPSGIAVSVEGREKTMVLDGQNPLIMAAILHICCRAGNPLDLSHTPVDITFA